MRRQSSRLLITLLSLSLLLTQIELAAAEGPAPIATPSPAPSSNPTAGVPAPAPTPTLPPRPKAKPRAAPWTPTSSTVLPYGSTGYRYKVVAYGAQAGFEATTYDDVAGGFGDGAAPFANDTCAGSFSTSWTGLTDLLVRKHLTLPAGASSVTVWVAIDNDVQLFWNGTDISGGLVPTEGCGVNDKLNFAVPAGLLLTGDNLLSARAHNRDSTGSQRLDLRVMAVLSGAVPAEQTFGPGGGHGNNPTRFEAEPVNTATGNYVSQVTDLALPGRGVALAFTRTYNSLDPSVGPLGPGWTHSYAAHLTIGVDASARLFAEDGAQLLFAPDGAGGFLRPAGAYDSLIKLGDNSYQLTRRDQLRYHFDSSGLLLTETDRNANALTFGYSTGRLTTITDSVGRSVTLGYDGSGRLTSLGAPLSRTVSYAYDGGGRLATVTDLRGGLTRYTYDAGGRLATIVDANTRTVVTNEYGADGRISAQTDARGYRSTFAWNAATQTSTFTDARGGAWVDVYAGNLLQSNSDPLGDTATYAYDANFNRTSITDPRGNVTSFSYDPNSNLLSRTAPVPLSYVESWTYTARNDVASHTDGRGNTTSYAYDAASNLVTMTQPGTAITGYGRDPGGSGLLVSLTDPRGKLTAYAYDAQANRTSATSPLGERTTMSYDAAGRMTSLVEPRGNVTGVNPADYTTTLAYDAADHLVSSRDPLGSTTTQTYDPVGNLLTRTDPNGRATMRAYDAANHLVGVTDPAAKLTAYGYDAVGNLVTRTDANNHLTTYAYDLAQRLTSTTDALNHTWTVAYDAAGNAIARTDAKAKTTTLAYDALNRLSSVTYADPATPTVGLAYDANGNRTALSDGAGSESYAYDPRNQLTGVTRGADSFAYSFDAAGNLLSRTAPDGSLTSYTYDGDGRMASASFPLAAAPTTTSFAPAADAHVKNTNPATNYGAATSLLVKNDPATTIYRAYLKFSVSGLGAPVAGALLRLYSTTTSTDASRRVCVAAVADTTWSETAITWSNAPAAGQQLSCLVGTQAAGWVSYDLGAAIGGNGTYSLVLTSTSPDAVTYSSKEGANPPQLVITTAGGSLDTAAPSVPAGLAATTVSAAQIDLAWTAAADNVGVSGYRVYRDGSLLASTGGPAYSDVGLETASTHTYTVAALDAAGNASAQSASATATSAGARFSPAADAHVKNTNPATNFGAATTLLVKNDPATTIYRAYLKFTVSGWSGAVGRATLVMSSTTNSADATRQVCVAPVANTTWGETTITWSNAPAIGSPNLSCVTGDQAVGAVRYDLGSAVSGNGTYSFALTSTSPAAVTYASKEGTTPPALLLAAPQAADTTAPSAPSNLSAAAPASNRVNLAWSAASDNVAVTRYLVTRNGAYLTALAGSLTAYADTAVGGGLSYTYAVTAYDAAGNASPASAPASGSPPAPSTVAVTTYTYDPAGQLIAAASPDGLTTKSTYDRAGRLLEVATVGAGGTLSRFTLAYDPAGNPLERTSVSETAYYAYDALDRLTSACTAASCAPPGGAALACLACAPGTLARPAPSTTPNPADTLTSYTYDPLGNRLSQTTYLGTTSYAYDAADRLTSVTAPGNVVTAYAFDNNGNQTAAGSSTYAYDLADRLTSATVGATTQTYTYAGDGLRLSAATGPGAATTRFVWDRAFGLPQLALERDGSGALVRRASYGQALTAVSTPAASSLLHPDPLGSVSDVVAANGSSLAWSEYAAFGTLRFAGAASGAPTMPYGFTSQYRDAPTGLYHLRARQYDPTTGRFLTTDPMAAPISDPYVASYVYVRNNPTRYVDPSGLASESPQPGPTPSSSPTPRPAPETKHGDGINWGLVLEVVVKCGYAGLTFAENGAVFIVAAGAGAATVVAPNPVTGGLAITAVGVGFYNLEHTHQAVDACFGGPIPTARTTIMLPPNFPP